MKRTGRISGLVAASVAFAWAGAAPEPAWKIIRSDHFEIYTQADSGTARLAASWFERLRAFFEQRGLESKPALPVRVIGFSSRREFDSYKLRAGADAYYIGTESRNYIVLPGLGVAEFVTAAHEYTHARLHASGWKLPPWLSEGAADFFSTVRISERESDVGADLPARMDVLRQKRWMPIAELFAAPSPSVQTRNQSTALFYAESWALTEMLALSDGYRPKFWQLVDRLGSGTPGAEGLRAVYSKSVSQIESDLHRWVDRDRFQPLRFPGVTASSAAATVQTASASEASLMLADLALASGELDRAKEMYEGVVSESASNAEAWSALGVIALRQGKPGIARANWRRAIANGLKDAQICYRYAALADEAGGDADELRPALERAVELEPGFDDARYKLALLESNAGRYDAALEQLRAMREVPRIRAYGYWMATAYALEELGRRGEGKAAAAKALEKAGSPEECIRARQLAYLCDTDLAVQLARDEKGQLQVMTTRAPHGAANWNPFIEPGDRMQRAEGRLVEIRCEGGKATGIVVSMTGGSLKISIADPAQVAMRNAPSAFSCGAQTGATVIVDYAALTKADGAGTAGIARGIEFR